MKQATKTIDSLVNAFIGKEDKRQGIVRNPQSSVMKRIGSAARYIRSRPKGITSTEENLLRYAYNDLKIALENTNEFYNDRWDILKNKIEGLELSDFKSTERFILD